MVDEAELHPLGLDAGKPPVIGKAVDAEVDGAEFFVGQALFQQCAGLFDHVGDVFAGLGVVLRPLDAECIQAFEEDLFPVGGESAEIFSAFEALAHCAVVDVAQVHGVLYLVAAIF